MNLINAQLQMTVANAQAFLEAMEKDGHSHELMAKIGTDFNADHMTEALKQKGITREDMLKKASGGGNGTNTTTNAIVGAAAAAA